MATSPRHNLIVVTTVVMNAVMTTVITTAGTVVTIAAIIAVTIPAGATVRSGGYVSYNDWHRGYYVDYRRYHLRQPPRGYEWRRVDNNYVLAAVATGLIASVVLNGGY